MLDYVALILLIVIFGIVVYGVIAVYGIPYEIAKARNHPHRDAIAAATWVSLFTLGILWPFLWIWAMVYHPDRGWGFTASTSLGQLESVIAQLEGRIAVLERSSGTK